MVYLPLALTLFLVAPAVAAIAILRSPSMRWYLALFGFCIFYGAFPLLLAWGGLRLSDHFGCEAEAIVFVCPAPSWHGDLITGMVFAHWLAIITIPSAVLGAIGLLMSWVIKVKRLSTLSSIYRSRRHKVIAGICAAIAQHWRLPIQGVRIVTVILAVAIPGLILFLYLWLWLAFPLKPLPQTI
ncbi:MAG: PspC domain-containing protein [Nodularia sp. (in: cyanobacteria)]|nr:PspC domain-containing protein [Nodularia sp. (in: cyanobacteria)]